MSAVATSPRSSSELRPLLESAEADLRAARALYEQITVRQQVARAAYDTAAAAREAPAAADADRTVTRAGEQVFALRTEMAAAEAAERDAELARRRERVVACELEIARMRAERDQHHEAKNALEQPIRDAEFELAQHVDSLRRLVGAGTP